MNRLPERKKERTMKDRALGTKFLLALVTLGVLAYFGIQAFRYFTDPLATTAAYAYSVDRSVSLSGYVVRQELVLEDSGGLLRLQRTEGERVSAGGTVALVYSDQASLDRQTELASLEARLEQLQFAQQAAQGAEVSLKLDTQILQGILDLRGALAARTCGLWCSSGTIHTARLRTSPARSRSSPARSALCGHRLPPPPGGSPPRRRGCTPPRWTVMSGS